MLEPKKLKKEDLPLVVLVDDKRSFMGFAIKAHSRGNYSHIMDMVKPGIVATQSPTGFKELPIDRYMGPQFQMKFWCYKGITKRQKRAWREVVQKGLNDPWWKRSYDFLGIIGHLIPGRWTRKLNVPFTRYCSERVAENLRRTFGLKIPKHLSPVELNTYFESNKNFEVYGYWFKG